MTGQSVAWSLFNSAKDNRPKRCNGTWPELVALLTTIQPTPKGFDDRQVKLAIPAISGTTFKGTRAVDHAEEVHLIFFDFDNSVEKDIGELHPSGRPKTSKVPVESPITPLQVHTLLKKTGLAAVIYTTFSHTKEWPKFRVVLPLAKSVEPTKWDAATEWCIHELGFNKLRERGCIDIPVLKDVARLNFLACSKRPRSIKFFVLDGEALAVPDNLPEVLPAEPVHSVVHVPSSEHTAEEWWKQYSIDFKTLDLVKVFAHLGVKVGKQKVHNTGSKWRCSCPWECEHTNAAGGDCAVIIHDNDSWPSFSCSHSVHTGQIGLKDICARVGDNILRDCAAEFETAQSADGAPEENKVEKDLRDICYRSLELTSTGARAKVPANLTKILRLDPHWGPRLSMDEMSHNILYDLMPQNEHFVLTVQEWIQDIYHLDFKRSDIMATIAAQAATNMVHPVRNWLRGLKWDGVPRIKRIASECLGVHTQLASDYLRLTLVGAVRRVMEPGVKMDTLPILIGGQGNFKSTFWRILTGAQWFNDSPVNPGEKDGWMVIHYSWCTELAELDGITSSKGVEQVKQFTSVCEDKFRPPYGQSVQAFKRTCFLVGTANREDLLMDTTGSRRFWPIKCGRINLAYLQTWRGQLWAEAVVLCDAGEKHWLDAAQEEAREEDSVRFRTDDPLADQLIKAACDAARMGLNLANGISITTLLEQMLIPIAQQTKALSMRAAAELRSQEWTKKRAGPRNHMMWFAPKELIQLFAETTAPSKF